MTAALERNPLTELVLTTLRATGFAVGDGQLPDASWIGQPNLPESEYQPFAVLSELTADRSEGPLGESQGDWRLPYMIEYFGIRRDQVTWIADRMRGELTALRFSALDLGADSYKIQYVRTDTIGGPQMIDVTHPPFWHQQDNDTIYVTKRILPA